LYIKASFPGKVSSKTNLFGKKKQKKTLKKTQLQKNVKGRFSNFVEQGWDVIKKV